ncbi:MAG: FkbM family methyltransferase [Akkermansiaceae bacterium]
MNPEILLHRGIKIPLIDGIISPKIIEKIKIGRYETNEAIQLGKLIEKGEVILEIGGGIGFISSIAALNPNTRSIEVFEANPNLRPMIHALHTLNGIENVTINTGVLMHNPSSATVPFYVHPDFWASSLNPGAGDRTRVEVPVFNLNATIERIRPSLIICDIEGGEIDLFEHADLKGVQKVLLEIHQNVVGRSGIKRLFDMFSARNFHYDEHHSSGSVILFSNIHRTKANL